MGMLLRLLIAPRTVDEKHSFWLAGLHSIALSAETVYPIQPPRRLAVPPLCSLCRFLDPAEAVEMRLRCH